MEKIVYIIDDIFEGPLDLLLFLVKEKKIEIYQIPIIFLIQQFSEYLKKLNQYPIEDVSSFISIISELINIKSRNIINKDDEPSSFFEDENGYFNNEFAEKILEYKSLKDAFEKIYNDEEKNIIPLFNKNPSEIFKGEDDKWESISIIDLFKHFEALISKLPKQKDFIIARSSITVDEMIKKIKELLNQNDFLLFSNISMLYSSRIEFICLFLAILELVKSKYVIISQIDHFSDIKISKIKR
jgi:segregation and condensation protein A